MDKFKKELEIHFKDFFKVLSTKDGDWTVKGFIDIYKNIYTISVDTKVISKIIELMIFPIFLRFAKENNYEMVLSTHQNHYPDITFINKNNDQKIAIDLKSTYRLNDKNVNGMTLGAFTGYFRNRTSSKNITFPYSQYSKHYVLGIIYSNTSLWEMEKNIAKLDIKLSNSQRKKLSKCISESSKENIANFAKSIDLVSDNDILLIENMLKSSIIDERKKFTINDLNKIMSVVRDFDFFIQEKWRIAIDRPGSGNTKNIGSTNKIDELKLGKALFTKYPNGKELFDDYWIYYLTRDMAKAVDLGTPAYNNLNSYFIYKGLNFE